MNLSDYQNVLSGYSNPILLKQGGQKVVYRVHHPDYGDVALKIGSYSSKQSLERIQREVSVLRDIDSIYYPKNHDFHLVHSDGFVIIEEYIESKPLSQCLGDYTEPSKIIAFCKHLIIGLKIIWDKRIVHRDIKPDNILITTSGIPKIIDLGIARLLDEESLTRSLAMRGPCTPIYAAPEQLTNRKTEIDFRTDQFNIGIVMLQLLLQGRHPFDPQVVGTGSSTVENIVNNNWDKSALGNKDIDHLHSIINRLLGHEPFQRYRKADILLNDLDEALGEQA